MNSRQLTNYIKGFAIVTVLVDHYSGQFLSHYYGWIGDYANGFIAVFFFLSGYGLFYSFEKRFAITSGKVAVARYFVDRALRILPFYWLSLYIAPWIFPGNFEILHRPGGWLIYLGLPFMGAPWLYWFLTALFQCYLAAPLLYFILKRIPLWTFLSALAGLALIALPFSLLLPFTHAVDVLEYRYFLGAHLILFALGMASPAIVARMTGRVSRPMLAESLAALLLTVYLTRTGDDIFYKSHIALIPLMILSTFVTGVVWLSLSPSMPFQKVLATLGMHSYPIYLFHIPFFGLLLNFGLLKNNDPMSIVTIIVLIPIFLYLCIKAEEVFVRASRMMTFHAGRVLRSTTEALFD